MVFDSRTMICRKLGSFFFAENTELNKRLDNCRTEPSVRAVLHFERDAGAARELFTRQHPHRINSLGADLAHQLSATGAEQLSIKSSFGSADHLRMIDHSRDYATCCSRYRRALV